MMIEYVNTLPGSGKTYGATQLLLNLPNCHPTHVYSAITIKLCNQVYKDLTDAGKKVKLIHSKTPLCYYTVAKEILHYLQSDEPNKILICTHSAIRNLPYIPKQSDTVLIVDEIPDILQIHHFNLKHNRDFLLKCLTPIEHEVRPKLYSLVLTNDGDKIVKRSKDNDDIDNIISSLLADIKTGKDIYVEKEPYDQFLSEEIHELDILTIDNPTRYSGFKKAIFLSAHFEYSILYKYWKDIYNIDFQINQEIYDNLRCQENSHKHGGRAYIHYLTENPNWSKYLRAKLGGIEELDKIALSVIDSLGNPPFIYATSNDCKNEELDERGGKRISVKSHGSNDYSSYHCVYLSPALNLAPRHYKLMEYIGFDPDYIRGAINYATYDQLVMRSALRDPDAKAMVDILVPDKGTADWLARIRPGCRVTFQDSPLARTSKGAKPVAARHSYLHRLKLEEKLKKIFIRPAPLDELLESAKDELDGNFEGGLRLFEAASLKKIRQTRKKPQNPGSELISLDELSVWTVNLGISIFGNHFSEPKPFQLDNIKLLAELLRLCHKDVAVSKHDRVCISPANCDGKGRKTENIIFLGYVHLDFDNGLFTPEDFESLFGTGAKRGNRLSFAIYNSFSHDPEKGVNKFHVVIPIQRPVSVNEYKKLLRFLLEKIESAGFTKHGLDSSCSKPTQMYHMPSTNSSRPQAAFFRTHYLGDVRDIERHVLKPDKIVGYYATGTDLGETAYLEPALTISEQSNKAEPTLNESTIRNMLKVIPPDLPRNEGWLAVLFALKDFERKFGIDMTDLAARWSAGELGNFPTPANYMKGETEKVLRSMKPSAFLKNPITIGTLIYMATHYGYVKVP